LHGFLNQPTHSNLAMHLHADSGNDLVQLLNDEIYNLGVMWNVQDTGNLISLPYRSDHLCAVVPQSHPLATLSSVAIKDLEEYDIVSVQSFARAEARVRRMKLKGDLPTLRIRLVMPSTINVLDSVRAGIGVGFAPLDAQQQLPNSDGLVFIPLLDGWARRHFVVCYKDSERTPAAAKRLAHYLSEQAMSNS
jgi:DNA-binding transcriptional LysR family regulator